MDKIYAKLKELNGTVDKGKLKLFMIVLIAVIAIGIILGFVESIDIVVSVLLVFFSLILLMILSFVRLMKLSAKRQMMQVNTINTVYRDLLEKANDVQGSDYSIESDSSKDFKLPLFQSYAKYDLAYTLNSKSSNIEAYKVRVSLPSSDGRSSTVFHGLYLTLPLNLETTILYKQNFGFLNKVNDSLTSINIQNDTSPFSDLQNTVEYGEGKIYSNKATAIPTVLKSLISAINSKLPKHTLRIGINNNILHLAIDGESNSLPIVKKYNRNEFEEIKKIIERDLLIIGILSNLETYI